MRLRAKIGMLAIGVGVVAGLAYGFMPRAVPVDLAEVKRGPLAVTVEEEGKTRVTERYQVTAPVAGYVRRIDLKAGDTVAAGQVLALIEPARSVAFVPRTRVQAQAQVKATQAAVAVTQENARAAGAAAQLEQQVRV
ncbi:MAG: biotin/lipoyl-binding protein, partial [Deltaproteobacteria bacterium]|nr:biotin/lipoyl-binding protein [Deltaproteobacteria bacterium]